MFHHGDLQSGIALAVEQSKAVLCFVHGIPSVLPRANDSKLTSSDDSDTSKQWEDVLEDEPV